MRHVLLALLTGGLLTLTAGMASASPYEHSGHAYRAPQRTEYRHADYYNHHHHWHHRRWEHRRWHYWN